MLQSDVGVKDDKVQPEIGMDDSNDATTQQAAASEEFARLTKMRQRQGTTAWAAEQNKQFDRAGHCDTITFLKREMFACALSCLFFPLYFVCCLLLIFSALSIKNAEAGTKGDMSYLDAPDA